MNAQAKTSKLRDMKVDKIAFTVKVEAVSLPGNKVRFSMTVWRTSVIEFSHEIHERIAVHVVLTHVCNDLGDTVKFTDAKLSLLTASAETATDAWRMKVDWKAWRSCRTF
jgi:hypothetical protein